MGNSSVKCKTSLKEKEIGLLAKKTSLSRQEILDWHAKFLKTFPSGELDLAEFNKVYQNFFPNGNPEKYAKFAFKVFDKDNNGKINFSEFIATTALSMKSSKFDLDEKGYEFAFDLYDHDKNEKVDKKEALTLLTAIYELKGEDQDESPETRVEKLFTKHDTNKNGYLDKSEFIKALSLDPNLRKHFLVK